MKRKIDIASWNRKAHYAFFSTFEDPYFGITSKVECTIAYKIAKSKGSSFFLYYLYRAIKAANSIENFRYRIVDNEVYEYERIDPCATIKRSDGTFGFSFIEYHSEETIFYDNAILEIERVQNSDTLFSAPATDNVIHFSAMPWIDLSSVSHARRFSYPDSCPKISFGKMMDSNGVKTMAISVHVHHALVDGYHIGLFLDEFQKLLNKK